MLEPDQIWMNTKKEIEPDLSPSPSTEDGLDFVLAHFKDQQADFPRTISTYMTGGKQVVAYSRDDAVRYFKEAGMIDCRINAYPQSTEFRGTNCQAPNLVFIDIDRSEIKSARAHKLAASKTLRIIQRVLDGVPSVVWSGNGYHIYQPIEAFVLEQVSEFCGYEQPSAKFLQFAASYLSGGRSDPSHHPSFKSCLLRIPGSLNSKCITTGKDPLVKILQKWDGKRPSMKFLIGDYLAYMFGRKAEETKNWDEWQNRRTLLSSSSSSFSTIPWIERLLVTGMDDCRKVCINLILAPYLINIKRLQEERAQEVIAGWLEACNSLRPLDFAAKQKIRSAIRTAARNGIPPLKFKTMVTEYSGIYRRLSASGMKC